MYLRESESCKVVFSTNKRLHGKKFYKAFHKATIVRRKYVRENIIVNDTFFEKKSKVEKGRNAKKIIIQYGIKIRRISGSILERVSW